VLNADNLFSKKGTYADTTTSLFQTVYGSLFLALDIRKGETLLIRGGTSSIGLLAIQLAKNAGLQVIATTRSNEKRGFLFEKGCDEVLIDDGDLYRQMRNSGKRGVDKVLELVGTATLKDSLACARTGGTVCMAGMLSEQWLIPDFAPMEFIPAAIKLTIYDSGQLQIPKEYFQDFLKDIESGRVSPVIGNVFSLNEIVAAHQLMDSNNAGGKIVVTVN